MTCSELAHSFSFRQWGKRKKENKFDQESSKKVECFDADLRFYDESGEFTYKGITGQKWYWRWYCSFIPKIFVVATWSPIK
jgi:hypothetical protein